MAVKFDVKMTQKALFDFSLYTSYTSIGGIAGVVLGGAGLVMAINHIASGNMGEATTFLLIAVFFLVANPITMWTRCAEQLKRTPMFQKPITYEFTEEGVLISQDDQSVLNEWKDFEKAISTSKSIILYITKVRALILPKESLGEQYGAAVKMISTHMAPKKVKIRHTSV